MQCCEYMPEIIHEEAQNRLFQAITDSDLFAVQQLVEEHPELLKISLYGKIRKSALDHALLQPNQNEQIIAFLLYNKAKLTLPKTRQPDDPPDRAPRWPGSPFIEKLLQLNKDKADRVELEQDRSTWREEWQAYYPIPILRLKQRLDSNIKLTIARCLTCRPDRSDENMMRWIVGEDLNIKITYEGVTLSLLTSAIFANDFHMVKYLFSQETVDRKPHHPSELCDRLETLLFQERAKLAPDQAVIDQYLDVLPYFKEEQLKDLRKKQKHLATSFFATALAKAKCSENIQKLTEEIAKYRTLNRSTLYQHDAEQAEIEELFREMVPNTGHVIGSQHENRNAVLRYIDRQTDAAKLGRVLKRLEDKRFDNCFRDHDCFSTYSATIRGEFRKTSHSWIIIQEAVAAKQQRLQSPSVTASA